MWTEQNEKRHQDFIAERQKVEAARIARAVSEMDKHEYRALVDAPDMKIWRCMTPGTNNCAFDIMMTRFGIAVVGDVANLTFSVGISYGLKFLAGNDVTYYIHSKLDEKCKRRELDQPGFLKAILDGICERITEETTDDEAFDELPKWVHDESVRGTAESHWDDLVALVEHYDEIQEQVGDILSEARGISHLDEARAFFENYYKELNIGQDWYEIGIDKPCENLIVELYMIRHAAQAILAQKEAEDASFVLSSGWSGNALLFWKKGGAGYTTDINQAERYTEEKAKRLYAARQFDDVPWPLAKARSGLRLTIMPEVMEAEDLQACHALQTLWKEELQ